MSAGAVRQGKVFVEIGADPKAFLSAMAMVNKQIASLGQAATDIGVRLGVAGAAITAPLAAASAAFAGLNGFIGDVSSAAGIGAANLDGLQAAAARLGVVIDGDAARASIALRNALADLSLASRGVAVNVGQALAPSLAGVAKAASDAAVGVSKFIRENPQLVRVVAAAGGAAVAGGVAFSALGIVLRGFAAGVGGVVGPVASFAKQTAVLSVNLIRLGVSFVAANFGTITMLAGVGAVVAVLGTLTHLLDGAASALSGAFTAGVSNARSVLAGLLDTASTTIEGVFAAFSSGDISGAIDIVWIGAQAAWARGSAAFMGPVESMTGWFQDAFDVMGTAIAQSWESVYSTVKQVFTTMGAWIMGAWDNIVRSIMPAVDEVVGQIQKLIIRIQDFFAGATDTQAKLQAIDDENQRRQGERERTNPGKDARLSSAAAENAATQAAADANIAAMQGSSSDRIAGREREREDRRRQRQQEIADFDRQLAEATTAAKDRVPLGGIGGAGGPGVAGGRLASATEVRGSFSAMASSGLGFGTKGVGEQQLDVLKRIATNTKEPAQVGP